MPATGCTGRKASGRSRSKISVRKLVFPDLPYTITLRPRRRSFWDFLLGSTSSVHDKPDVAFHPADPDIGLIGSESIASPVVVMVYKRLDTDCGSLAVVGYLLVGDPDPVDILHRLGGLSEREPEVDMVRETEAHDMLVIPAESEAGCVIGQTVEIHAEKVYCKLTVDVVNLIFVLAVFFLKVFFIDLLQVVEIIGTLGIDALMYNEMFPVLHRNQVMVTVRALEPEALMGIFPRSKWVLADFAEKLGFGTVVFVKVDFWSVASRTGAVIIDVTFFPAFDWLDGFEIIFVTPFQIRHEITIVPWFHAHVRNDPGKFINFEFLIFWRVRVIEGPLPKRDISADEIDQPAVHLIKVLNYL